MQMRHMSVILLGLTFLPGCGEDGASDPFAADTSDTGTCPVGSEGCPCTQGGACDDGLTCLSMLCVDADGTSSTSGGTSSASSTTDSTSSTTATTDPSAGTGPLFDVGENRDIPGGACRQDVDVVFSMDVSTSMTFLFDALLADMAEVDQAIQNLEGDPRYGLVVFVDDYQVDNGGAPYPDVQTLMTDFQTWKGFTTSFSEPQINGGTNTTWPENSLDSLWHAANDFQWRPAETTLRIVIHATDDTFTENPSILDGIPVERTYDETITALQGQQIRVGAFAAKVGGSLFSPTNVEAGWFTPWDGKDPIPVQTDGVVHLIDGIQNNQLSLAQAIIDLVEEKMCDPYPEG